MIYGRTGGVKLGQAAKRRLDLRLPEVSLALHELKDPVTFTQGKDLFLEIGFGGGEHLADQARQYPEFMCLGIEPFTNGIASLLKHMDDLALDNIRILRDDARLALSTLPEASVSAVAILFPDPWPKKRHHKRRIVSEKTIAACHRCLGPKKQLLIATDHTDYLEWILDVMEKSAHLFALVNPDNSSRPVGHQQTRYEAKAIREGRTPVWLDYLSL